MKKLLFWSVLPCAILAVLGSRSSFGAAPSQRAALFNSRDLAGWHLYLSDASAVPGSVWRVSDGVLKFNTKINGYLKTQAEFSDYKLHVEWRWPKEAVANSNSGVLVHVHGPDAIWPLCFECQLKTGNAGQIVGTGLDIPAAPLVNKRKRAPKMAESSEKPLGEWNSYDITCRGDTIEAYVNGVRQNFVENLPATAGKIALQLEGYPVDFRNIWIEPASSSETKNHE